MKYVILGLIFLLVCLLNVIVSAQESGAGNTIINATVAGELKLNLSLTYPEIIIPEDYYFYENLTVFQGNSQNISVYLNKSDTNDFVKFVNETPGGTYYQDDYTLYLPVNTYKNVTLRVYVPPAQGFDGGTYNIPIYAYSLNDYRSNTTTLKVTVNTTNPIDDIEIVSIYPSSLYSGESLSVNISIHKIFPSKATDIQICYCINENPGYSCGPSYNNYGCSWKAITEWLNYTKTVTVNEDPGTYYFIIAVKYPNSEDIKRANSPQFYVKSVPSGPTGPAPGPLLPPIPQPRLTIIAPYYLEASPGEKIGFDVEVGNTGNANAFSTSLNIYGIPENWVSITPHAQDIGIGKSKKYSVLISLPSEAYEQIYSLSLVAKSGTVEIIKVITMTVAMTLEKRARFLLDEARSKKREAEVIISKAKGFGMDTTEPESGLILANDLLEETQRLFESRDYEESIGRAKQAIEGYKSVISSVKEIVKNAFFTLLDEVTTELGRIEKLTEEKDVVEAISYKINRSTILQRQERVIEAYQTLLEAKRLLDQLKGKIYFRGLTQTVLIISMIIVIIVVVAMSLFYRKMMSKFVKKIRIEEHKKRLSSLFKREVRPSVPSKVRLDLPPEERLKTDKEKMKEIRRLLEIGEELADTDTEKMKEAYVKAKKIYNSLPSEEKRIVGEEILRLTRLYNKIVRKKPEEERPAIPKEKPRVDKEKIDEILRLLKTGVKLADTNVEKAKDAFTEVREIYNSLSPGEKKSIDRKITKAREDYDKIVKKSRKEKE